MLTDNAMPNVDVNYTSLALVCANPGPGRLEDNKDYANLAFELLRTGMQMYENDGYITLVGCLADTPAYKTDDKEFVKPLRELTPDERAGLADGTLFVHWTNQRFLCDVATTLHDQRIAITINVKRVMRWRGDTMLANRIDIAGWDDFLLHTKQMPDGAWRKGTYHYAVLMP